MHKRHGGISSANAEKPNFKKAYKKLYINHILPPFEPKNSIIIPKTAEKIIMYITFILKTAAAKKEAVIIKYWLIFFVFITFEPREKTTSEITAATADCIPLSIRATYVFEAKAL